jgi:hypothetical protein
MYDNEGLDMKAAHPLKQFSAGCIYHLSNKYIALRPIVAPGELEDHVQHRDTVREYKSIFSSCFEFRTNSSDTDANVTILGDSCYECLIRNGSAYMYTKSWRKIGSQELTHWVNATFECTPYS